MVGLLHCDNISNKQPLSLSALRNMINIIPFIFLELSHSQGYLGRSIMQADWDPDLTHFCTFSVSTALNRARVLGRADPTPSLRALDEKCRHFPEGKEPISSGAAEPVPHTWVLIASVQHR